MKTTTNLKYIEWRDTNGLHEDTLQALSDLEFLKDELQFLEDLVAEHTLELIYGRPFEESRRIAEEITQHEKRLLILMENINEHRNKLQILMDEVDVPSELKDYKNEHYKLMVESMDFHADVKKTKRSIFKMLAETMKKSKQKRLL